MSNKINNKITNKINNNKVNNNNKITNKVNNNNKITNKVNNNKQNNINNNFILENINKNKLSNDEKIVYNYIKLPEDKYEFYDEYLPEKLKKYYKNPIGVYDPYGNNINPLTNKPYQNIYNDKINEFKGGPLIGHKFNETYMNWAYIWSTLPLCKIVGDIISSIRNNNITVIKAGTGVGKSFLGGRICSQAFNFQKKIIMTLPKKLIARKSYLICFG